MEKVVYLLGAGFSAPLGVPVMSDFLTKSRDLYYSDPVRFAHFQEVFDTISELSVIKNFYLSDLFNIEEILSILEMREYLEGKDSDPSFFQYLADVVKHYTPPLVPCQRGEMPGNWWDWLFSNPENRDSRIWESYGHFVGSVCKLSFSSLTSGARYSNIECIMSSSPDVQYSLVTLNYDCVIESILSFLNDNYAGPEDVTFPIAKLHGSVDSGVIVPPTWSKGRNRTIVPAWKQAYDALTEANHLRIIGYSLPTADAYVKYLLKSAVMKAKHLKTIDVICLEDRSRSTEARYREFMSFSYYRFADSNVLDYFKILDDAYSRNKGRITLNKLEDAHHQFFAGR